MNLSYLVPIVLGILAIIMCVLLILSIVYWDNGTASTLLFILTCILAASARCSFLSIFQNRKAVKDGSATYKIEIGEKVYEEELFKSGHKYYDTDHELRFKVDENFLIIYEDGEKVGVSSNYTIRDNK